MADTSVKLDRLRDVIKKDTGDTGWKKASPEKKDKYGNVVKTQNVARHLARLGMQSATKAEEAKPGLYANIHAKRARIAAGSGERMRKPGSKGAPTPENFKDAAESKVEEDNKAYREQDRLSKQTTGMSLTQRTKMYNDIQKNLINQEKEYRKQGILPPKNEEVELDEVSADVAKRVAQSRDRSAVANKLTSTQSRRLKMGDKGGDPDMNAGNALKSAMKRGAKNVYGEEVELDEAINHLQMAKHHQALAKEHDRISHKAAGDDVDDLSIAHTHQSEDHQDAAKAHLKAHQTGNKRDVAAAKKASKESLNNYTTHLMSSNYSHFYNVTGKGNSTDEGDHKDYNYSNLRSGADAIKKGLKEEVELDEALRHEIAGQVGRFIGNKIDPVHGDIMHAHGKEAYRQAAFHIRKTISDVKDAVSSLHDRLHKQLRTGGIATEEVEELEELKRSTITSYGDKRIRDLEGDKSVEAPFRPKPKSFSNTKRDVISTGLVRAAARLSGVNPTQKEETELGEELSSSQRDTHFSLMNKHGLLAKLTNGPNKDAHRMAALDHQMALRNPENSQSRSKALSLSNKLGVKENTDVISKYTKLGEAKYPGFRVRMTSGGPKLPKYPYVRQGNEDPRTGMDLGFSPPPIKKDEPKKPEPKRIKNEERYLKKFISFVSEEQTIHPMGLHISPSGEKKNGLSAYKVHAVGAHLADGIKVGEHLTDTELDDAVEMGAKIKHIKQPK